jgi:hypothetical protein
VNLSKYFLLSFNSIIGVLQGDAIGVCCYLYSYRE